MKKIILLLAVLALSLGAFGCGGGGAGSSSAPTGENPGIPSVVQLSASHAIAQTNASVTLSAKVLDGNGAPLSGVQVIFTNLSEPFGVIKAALRLLGISKPRGVLSATVVTTDGSGLARVKLSSTVDGFATVQAEVNNGVGIVRSKKTVVFSSTANLPVPAPLPPTLTLDVSKDGILFNQPGDFLLFKNATDNQRTIRATVKNGSGSLMMNATVTFGADSTEVTFPLGNTKTTDSNGQASVLIQVDPSVLRNLQTVVNITATTSVDGMDAFNLVSLSLSPVTISTGLSSVTATPAIVAIGGTSAVTATVILTTGGPAPDGTSINFTTAPKTGADPSPCGSITPFSQLTGGVTTPAATFTAPLIPGKCTVTGKSAGVTIGTVDIVVNTPLSVQPGTQSISGVTGGAATFTVFGGIPGYTVTSPNPAIAFNGSAGNGTWSVASSGDTFVVTVPAGATSGNLALTVRDSAGTTVAATLTISPPGALLITPKTASVVSSAIVTPVTFTISGGTPGATGYITTSTDSSKAFDTAAGDGIWSGSPITVNFPANVAAGSVTLNVFDSLGATTTATITILGPAPTALLISPKLVSVVSSGSAQTIAFTISGGTAPYVTTSTDPSKVFDSVAGDGIWNVAALTANIPANVTAGSVTLNVLDAVGGTTTATITIIAGGALSVSPSSVSVTGVSGIGDNVTFTISGGSGSYGTTAFSSNTAVAPNAAISGNTFTVAPEPVFASTAVTFTVIDSVGAVATASVTVTPFSSSLGINPSTIAVFGSVPIEFRILGGTPNFKVYTSNTGIVTLGGNPITIGGPTFTANTTGAAGSATITVVDSDGKTVTATITVAGPSLAVTPPTASVTCTAGGVRNFVVTGGVAPYNVVSGVGSVIIAGSPVAVSGGSFSATLAAASCGSFPGASTTVPLVITDNIGTVISAVLTVTNP